LDSDNDDNDKNEINKKWENIQLNGVFRKLTSCLIFKFKHNGLNHIVIIICDVVYTRCTEGENMIKIFKKKFEKYNSHNTIEQLKNENMHLKTEIMQLKNKVLELELSPPITGGNLYLETKEHYENLKSNKE